MLIDRQEWLDKVLHWKNKWTIYKEQPDLENDKNGINLYKFIQVINKNLKKDSCIVSDAGSVLYMPGQSLELTENQRWIVDAGQAGMGAWQMSIGVCLARDKKETIVLTGDGSIMLGVESLAVIRKHSLPIKIFILSNNGYLSIRNSQKNYYNNRIFGSDSDSGLFFPDFRKIAISYDIQYCKIEKIVDLDLGIKEVLRKNAPVICEVTCDPNQNIWPTSAPKKDKDSKNYQVGLDQLFPFLSDEEYNEETIKD